MVSDLRGRMGRPLPPPPRTFQKRPLRRNAASRPSMKKPFQPRNNSPHETNSLTKPFFSTRGSLVKIQVPTSGFDPQGGSSTGTKRAVDMGVVRASTNQGASHADDHDNRLGYRQSVFQVHGVNAVGGCGGQQRQLERPLGPGRAAVG